MRALILAGLLAQPNHEPPVPAAIVWEAPAGCPDHTQLLQAITQRLAAPLEDAGLTLEGRVTRHKDSPRFRLALQLSIGGRSQLRTLTAERCASLVDATALLVALAVSNEVQAAEPALPPEPHTDTSEPVPDAEPTTDADATTSIPAPIDLAVLTAPPPGAAPLVAAPPPASRSSTLGALVRVHGGPELGAVPGLTGAVGFATGLLWRRARLEFQGLYLAPRTATRDASSARVSLIAGAMHGCARLGRGVLEFPLCGGLELGAVRARVQGAGARSATGLWLAGAASVAIAWHLHTRVSLSLALQGALRMVWPRYELAGPGPTVTLFEPAWVSGRLLLGLELRFGDPW